MLLAILLLQADLDSPRRVSIDRMPVAQTAIEAGACATRALASVGIATAFPLPGGGVGVDFNIKQLIAPPGEAMMTFRFEPAVSGALMQVLYRRPLSAKSAQGTARSVAKRCFRADWNSWAPANGQKQIK